VTRYGPIGDGNIRPMTTLKIARPGGGAADFVCKPALLDTGSPWTYIPEDARKDLGLSEIDRVTVTGVEARSKSSIVCEADLIMTGPEFDRWEFRAYRVYVHDLPLVRIGRDILATFVMVFDGPAGEWRLLP
jgi:hypothetical protein